jgi:hypothetical protein
MFNVFQSFRDKQKTDSVAITQLQTDFEAMRKNTGGSSLELDVVQLEI